MKRLFGKVILWIVLCLAVLFFLPTAQIAMAEGETVLLATNSTIKSNKVWNVNLVVHYLENGKEVGTQKSVVKVKDGATYAGWTWKNVRTYNGKKYTFASSEFTGSLKGSKGMVANKVTVKQNSSAHLYYEIKSVWNVDLVVHYMEDGKEVGVQKSVVKVKDGNTYAGWTWKEERTYSKKKYTFAYSEFTGSLKYSRGMVANKVTVKENSSAHLYYERIPEGLEYIVFGGTVEITGYTGTAKKLVIPEEIKVKPVKRIEGDAFKGCNSLTEVVIPDGVTLINIMAFGNCKNLKKITIPDSVTQIGSWAFYGCSSLTELVLPEGITSIEDYTFYHCNALKSINIPESVETIGEWAFAECSSLTELTIPEGVPCVEEYTFYRCSNLKKITLPDTITSIGDGAFSDCSSLAEFTIPEAVTNIGEWAFGHCSSLPDIAFSENIISIGDYAFRSCSGLTSVVIPESMESIGKYAFASCNKLETVKLPKNKGFDEKEIFHDSLYLILQVIENDTTRWGMWDLTYMEFIEMYKSIGTENDLFLQMLKEKGPRHTDPTIYYEFDGLKNLEITFPDVLTEKIYALHYAPFEYNSEDLVSGEYGKSSLEAYEDHGGVCSILANTYENFIRDILGETDWKYCQYSNVSADHAVLLVQTEDGRIFQIDNCGVDYWWLGVEFRPDTEALKSMYNDYEVEERFAEWENMFEDLDALYWHTFNFSHNYDFASGKWHTRPVWYDFDTEQFDTYFCKEVPQKYIVTYRGLQDKVISMAGNTRLEGYVDLSELEFTLEGSSFWN